MNRLSTFTIFSLLLFFSATLWAQEDKEEKKEPKPVPPPQEFVTSHQGTFGGKVIKYKAIAGETYLKNEEGEPVASIWSVTYKLDGPENYNRPVTFVFNGGPGSASVWLHLGLFGPQLTKVDSDARMDDGAAPYPLVNNNYGILDLTDLVFIDPVGTGYSRVVGKGKVEDYWGLNEDAKSIAKFMRLWVTKYKRWNSPKYIAGESFGTTRAGAVNYELEAGGQEMALNGLILISQCLDYQGSTSTHDNIVSNVTYLPSMAATSWYHKKAGQGKELEAFVEEARKFALDEYVRALYKGSDLTQDEFKHIAERLNYFTGLSQAYIELSDLRILVPRYRKELFRDRGLVIGQLDGRFMGDEADDVDDRPNLGDPASYNVGGAYTAALNHYYATVLNIEMDRPYLVDNEELGAKWRWRDVPDGRYWEPSYVNVARKLGDGMRRNKDLRIMVASGYYDLICPFFDAEYTFARHGLLKDRVTFTYYQAGHMMYLHEPDLVKLAADIRKFYTNK
ncbi:MAG TPA: peptidase S10 [Cyclobacteriaceae bacterium]|nr:peptidase S10 [Cyclobacteriaceae bacterium]